MAYNRKLLFPSEAPVWITEAGSLGILIQDGESPIPDINLSAAEFFNRIVTYSVTSSSLPTGLSLDGSTGVISGTLSGYSSVQDVNFTITATDTDGQTTTRDFSITVSPITPIEYLLAAGGGAGGNGMGGGGGAGGLVHNYQGTPFIAYPGVLYSILVGAGGAGTTSDVIVNGANSVFGSITAIGGGGASSLQMQRRQGILNANAGGSGGGSGASDPGNGYGGAGLQPSSASGGFGNPGGDNLGSNNSAYPGAGGGGAGTAGETPANSTVLIGGAGGAGLQVNIDGNNYYWAAGGGGDIYGTGRTSGGPGGIGGGGGGAAEASGVGGAGGGSSINAGSNGGAGDGSNGGNAGANTGSGGGGAAWSTGRGGNGGSGIVILRMRTNTYSGITTGFPTVTTIGEDTILTYTGSGTYTG